MKRRRRGWTLTRPGGRAYRRAQASIGVSARGDARPPVEWSGRNAPEVACPSGGARRGAVHRRPAVPRCWLVLVPGRLSPLSSRFGSEPSSAAPEFIRAPSCAAESRVGELGPAPRGHYREFIGWRPDHPDDLRGRQCPRTLPRLLRLQLPNRRRPLHPPSAILSTSLFHEYLDCQGCLRLDVSRSRPTTDISAKRPYHAGAVRA
jgi:hypothetical protein